MNYVNNKNKIYKVVFSLIGFILMLSGVSYAYFSTQVKDNETNSTLTAVAANLILEFKEGSNQINGDGIFPGWSATKTFTVNNKNKIDAYYNLYIDEIKNELMSESISYKIESTDGGYNGDKVLLPKEDGIIKTGIYIKANTTHTYKVTAYYNNLDIDQSSEKGKTFSFKINIKANINDKLIVDLNGGTSEQDFNILYKANEVIELKKPTRNGYTFAGWEVISGDGVILNNLIKNGSFEDGTNGWTIFDTAINNSNSYKKFGNTSIHNYNGGKWHTVNSVLSGDSYYYGKPNHIYYASSWMYVKQKGAGVCYTAIRVNNNEGDIPQAWLASNVMNTWQKKSGIINTKDEEYKIDYLVCGYNDPDGNIDCYCDGTLFVDLTESFGSGNEPEKAWCDKNLDYFDEYAVKIGNKATTIKAKWKKNVTLTNLIKNGSFENDTNDWLVANNSFLTISNSYQKFGNSSLRNYNGVKYNTVNSTFSGDNYYNGKANHIYYASSWMYVKQKGNGNCYTVVRVQYNASRPQIWLVNDVMNTWQKKSAIINTGNEEYKLDYLVCGYNNTDKNIECYCDGALLVDLTESFGTGNEPNKEWCDANLDWFDGTVSKEFIF